MDGFLKQSTAVTIKIGPFVDKTDGDTDETALTISQADVRLSKNGGNMAQKNESTSCTHDEIGYYDCPLDTTDTNTLGLLKVMVHESGGLHASHTFQVVTANFYDSMCSTDKLQVHVDEMTAGIITAAVIADDAIDLAALADDAISGIATMVWDVIRDGHATTGTFGATTEWTASTSMTQAEIRTAIGMADDNLDEQLALLAQVGDIATIGDIADAVWDEAIAGHVAAGSFGEEIQAHALTTDIPTPPTAASVADAVWDEAIAGHVAAGSFGEEIQAHALTTDIPTPPTAESIADAVWDEAIAGHVAAGSTGEALGDAGAAGDPWSTALPGAYGAGTAGKIVGDNINATISSRASQTSVDDIPNNAELLAAFTEIKGGTWSAGTDTLEAIRDRGDAAWLTATGFSTLDAVGIRAAIGMASADLDTQLDSLPTVSLIADGVLKRDWSLVTGEASHSLLNAARLLRNDWAVDLDGVLSVKKEDGVTEAWTGTMTASPGADPISGMETS